MPIPRCSRSPYLKSGLRTSPRGFASYLHQFDEVPRALAPRFVRSFFRWSSSPLGTSLRSANATLVEWGFRSTSLGNLRVCEPLTWKSHCVFAANAALPEVLSSAKLWKLPDTEITDADFTGLPLPRQLFNSTDVNKGDLVPCEQIFDSRFSENSEHQRPIMSRRARGTNNPLIRIFATG